MRPNLAVVIFFFSVLLFCTQASAGVDVNWEGDVNSDWNNANNWAGNVFPGAGNNAVIGLFAYANAPVISANSTHTVTILKIVGNGVLTIQANLTISGALILDGDNTKTPTLNMTGGTLTIQNDPTSTVLQGGILNLSGGTINNTGDLYIEDATVNVSNAGVLNLDSDLDGSGYLSLKCVAKNTVFNQTGGTTTLTESLTLDGNSRAGANNIAMNLSGGTFTNSGPTYFLKIETDLTTINVSGGNVTLAGDVRDNNAGKITINLSNGNLTFQGNLSMEVGDVFTQTGGTLTFEGGNNTWTNLGIFNGTGGTVVFNDPTATILSGAGTWNFYNVSINSGKVLTQSTAPTINIAGHWSSTGGTFNESTNEVAFNGSAGQTLTAETFYKLKIDKASGTLSTFGNITASNTLTMVKGNIDVGTYQLGLGTSVASPGTLTYTTGTIIGKFQRWINATATTYIFPVGSSTFTYPANVLFTTLTPGSLTGEFISAIPGNNGCPLTEGFATVTNSFSEGYWNFTAGTVLSTNYEFNSTITGWTSYAATTNTRIIKRANAGSPWVLQGAHNVSGSTVRRTNLSGTLTAQFTMGRTTCVNPTSVVQQPVTTELAQGSTDNEMLRIKIYAFGPICLNYASQFTFNTGGNPGSTSPANDIADAKIYYTGGSPNFSASNLFGSLGSSPNGNFTIYGNQLMFEDTAYFWLAYDVKTTATKGNLLDAQFVSFIAGDSLVTASNSNPAGSRLIKESRYSVATGNWNNTSTWSWYSGGPPGASVPVAGTDVFIEDGDVVTANNVTGAARNISITSGALNGQRSKLVITGTTSLTVDSVYMSTTGGKKMELVVQTNASLTVNNGVLINNTGATEDNDQAILVSNNATVSIGRNLKLTNPTLFNLRFLMSDNAILNLTGNIYFDGSVSDKTRLGVQDNSRINLAGAMSILPGKQGKFYAPDDKGNTVVNFNGTMPQILELTPNVTNASMWVYENVYINNTAGVTLNASLTPGPTWATIKKKLIVQSGTLYSGGYNINMPYDVSALFEVQNGATYYTTTLASVYSGIAYFGLNQDRGKITFGPTSTVVFGATGSQSVPGLTGAAGSPYGNIILAGSGTKTLTLAHSASFSNSTGAINVDGNLTINNGVKLDVGASSYAITIAGNWTDNNTVIDAGFVKQAGTVTFDGTSNQTITHVARQTYYGLATNKTSGSLVLANNAVVSNQLTMTQGNIDPGTNKLTLGMATNNNGNLTYTAGIITGKFERWIGNTSTDYLFPVGTTTKLFSATYNFTNLTDGSLITEWIATDPGSNGLPLTEGTASIPNQFTEGYWNVTAANSLASTNYIAKMLKNNFSSYAPSLNTRLLKRATAGSAWTLQGSQVFTPSHAQRNALSGIAAVQFGLGNVICTSSAAVAQTNTTMVQQGSPNNEMLRIKVYSNSASCSNTVTQFNFNTGGTPGSSNAAGDIANAKVYYTGTSSIFATSTLFGSLGSVPNGNFTINGSQDVTADTIYFWLTYDISTTATRDNVVDAKFVSLVSGGYTVTAPAPDPVGSRTIKEDRFAVSSNNWQNTATWSWYSGGPSGAPKPTQFTDVYIDRGNVVTVVQPGEKAKNIFISSTALATSRLEVNTGGVLTCDSVYMYTAGKKMELYVAGTGQLTVNNGVRINNANVMENNSLGFYVRQNGVATINKTLNLVNPSPTWILATQIEGTGVLTLYGNLNFDGTEEGLTKLSMAGTGRLNLSGTGRLNILTGKFGNLVNSDGGHNSVINFNASTPQVLDMTPDNNNSDIWQYSTVWINNTAGVTLNEDVTVGPTWATIQKALIVQSGTLYTGGWVINLTGVASSLFQVDNGATFSTTTTNNYGGIPYFGNNAGLGRITLGAASTVIFAAAGAQVIPGLKGINGTPYGNLIISGSGIKTLDKPHNLNFSASTGALDVDGNLTINNGASLDVSNNNYPINVAGNWTTTNTVADVGFTKRAGTVTFDGNGAQTISYNAIQSFYNLTINKTTGTLALGGNTSVTNTLTLTAGNITTGTYKITLGTSTANTGTLIRTNGTIIGKLERWINSTGTAILFPVGSATNYNPANITFTNLTGGSLIGEFIASNPGNNGLPLTEGSVSINNTFTEGYWALNVANSLVSTNYSLQLTGTGFTSNAFNSRTRIVKRANSGSAWTVQGTYVNGGTSVTRQRNSLSGFSEFTFGNASCSAYTVTLVTQPICNGGLNGAINATVSGGSTPYTYAWSNGATTEDISSIAAGNYTLTVTDFNGCQEIRSATITTPSGMSMSLNITDASLYGIPDGSVDQVITGGNTPYTYLWSDSSTSQDLINKLPGFYTITTTDANGCSLTGNATINYGLPYDTLPSGSFIINMGVVPQTTANGLKPYGMIYDLVKNYKVPIIWSIKQNKVKDALDFTYNGVDYKGGSFIIDEQWITTTVAARIAYWQSLGVVGLYTTSSVVVPRFHTFTGFTNLVIDDQSSGIVTPYFTAAGIPSAFYSIGLPSNLDDCSDTYVLPHADPTWAEHSYLRTFALNNGYIWAGCHAVSVLEGIANPSDVTQRMNFLSNDGLQCFGNGSCGPLITESHGNPTAPYTYEPTTADHPVMQFMGDMTPAQSGGSEQWYIPITTSTWRASTTNAIYTSDGAGNRKGTKLTYGRAYSNPNYGMIMYEGGHSVGGTGVANIAAQRAFFNFIFLSTIDKALDIEPTVPKTFVKNVGQWISIDVDKGSAPYTYSWTATCGGTFSNPDSSATQFVVDNLYTVDKCYIIVEVTDACGRFNFYKITINIIQPNASMSNYNGVNVSCNGACDGSIDLSVSGGTAPYTYQWSTGATTEDISGLCAGGYYVTITDADGYVSLDTITLVQAAAVGTSFSIINAGCAGAANGSIDLTPSGGIPPYTYAWSTGATTQDISGLVAATYTVTVSDANGCAKVSTATVGSASTLNGSLSVTNITTCFGAITGAIDLTPSGGTVPYTYLWSNGATTQDLTNLAAGSYTVTITDANLCIRIISGTVTQPAQLTSSATQINVACFAGSTGSIDLTPAGGTPAYTYIWSTGVTTQDISGRVAGIYTVTITDSRGCTATRSVTITQPAAVLSTSETHVNATCGINNGSIDLTISGGTTPYAYAWSSGQTTQDITSLGAATYTVTVTDANGCTATRSVGITAAGSPSPTLTQVNVTCNGLSNGSIDLSVSGGTPGYTYSWTGGAVTQDRSGLAAGVYNVTITDANGCTAITGTTITQPAALTASATQVNVSCNGQSNGSIDLTTSGGTIPYSYAWSNGATTQDISGLAIGTFTVTVTDANNCTTSLSRTITQPAVLTASNTHVDVSCNSGANGSVDLTPAGGTSPYTYLWSNGATSQDIGSLSAGTYTVTITDSRGCTVTSNATILQPTTLTASNTKVDILCNAGNNGSVDLTPSGGTLPYSYNWSTGATTQDIGSLTAGSYTVTITDTKGCTVSSSATIAQPAVLSSSASKTDVSCNGQNNGSIDLTPSGGTTPYTFLWSNGATTEDISSLPSGSYSVTLTDANGCTATRSVAITQPAVLSGILGPVVNVSCNAGTNGSIELTPAGGTTPYTYLWSNGATTEDITGLSAGGYTVTITDARGCTATTGTTITHPAFALSAAFTQVNVRCNGNNNGSIDLIVSGGTTPYTYSWSNGATTQDVSSLSAGVYNVTVMDNRGCTVTTGVTITQPAVLSASNSKTNITCNGGNDGTIDVTVSGGTAPFSFLWSSGAITEDLAGLTASTYTVTVTDANNCAATSSATLTQPAPISVTGFTVDASCNGVADGSIDLTVMGGVLPLTFSWGNGETTEDISNVPADLYSVTVTDASGCTATSDIPVGEASSLAITLDAQTNVNCNGDNNGALDISAAGGVLPYIFTWSTGASTEDINGLTAGTYAVTVTDAALCNKISIYVITQPTAMPGSATQVNVSCNGGSDGSIDLSTSGGTPPYSYNWSNGASSEDVSGLISGLYQVTVTDDNGCTATLSRTLTQPAVLATSITSSNVSCNGGNDGAVINLSVSGGTAPYTYLWSNGATSQNISGLTAAIYYVTVTDFKNCVALDSIEITEPSVLTSSYTQVNVSCNGENTGSVNLSVLGGTAPYFYNWSNGASTQDLNSIAIGSYAVTITDNLGCSTTNSATITEPSALVVSTSQVNVSCSGGNSGSIDLTVSGGTAPYTYAWSNAATTQDLTSITASIYAVTVTDALGCTATTSATITQPAVLSGTLGPVVNVSCDGYNDGSINITVAGGAAPYSYNWSNGATTEDISSISAGVYNITVTDANGCTLTTGTTITEPAVLTASAATSHVDVSCFGGSDGSVNLAVTGGTPPYNYIWSNAAITEDIGGLIAGVYDVTVTDAKGCSFSKSDTITEPTVLVISGTTSHVDVSCLGKDDGSIDLTVTGGTAPYDFVWSNGSTTEDLNGLTAGTYDVTVSDAEGCDILHSITILEPTLLVASATQVDVSCNGGTNGSIDLTISGGTSGYAFTWSNGAITEDITTLTAGSYTVTVTDASGCTATTTIVISEPAVLTASAAHLDVNCSGGNSGSIDISVGGGTTPYSFSWSNSSTTEDINLLIAGVYTVTITDANGCTASANATVSEPGVLIASSTQVNVGCNGGSDGSIDLNVAGGTAPYNYSWSNGDVTQDVTALTIGAYTVTVTDAEGCSTILSEIITQPVQLSSWETHVNVACKDSSTGSIDLTIAGGTPPYSYNWSIGAITEDLSGLTDGIYTVTVTDAHACTTINSITITEPTQLSASYTQVNITCNGANNGSVDVSVSGGTAPYTYTWSNGAVMQDINSLAIGTYTLTITDALFCTLTQTATIIQPAALSASTVQDNVNCNGESNGSIDLSVAGGSPPYAYSWSNGSGNQDIGNLWLGTYTVTVTDVRACTATASATITQPAALAVSGNTTDVSCFGGSDGAIDVLVSGGTPPFTYDWSTGDSTEDISNLIEGAYGLTVVDAHGCGLAGSVFIAEPQALAASVTTNNASCNGASNGSINLSVSFGTPPYTYSWSNGASTQDVNSLIAGAYTVTVTDANGCTLTTGATITEPAMLATNVTKVDVSCQGGSDGSIDLTVAGGTSPYSYIWSTGDSVQDVTNLIQGAYHVTVIDAQGCSAVESSTINEPTSITATAVQVNVSCSGGNTGSIDLSPSGGTLPYTFTWSTGDTTEDITGITAGIYQVTVTDNQGCFITRLYTITQPTALSASYTKQDVDCNGGNNGYIDLTVNGGTIPYTFNWSTGEVTEDNDTLLAGAYAVTVTDANGCSASISTTITQNTVLSIASTGTDVNCNGGNDGAIDVTVSGGGIPYTYIWSTGDSIDDITGLTAGGYTLTVTDVLGCTATTSLTITEPAALLISSTATPSGCNGGNQGAIDLIVNGGTMPYSFVWSNGTNTEDIDTLVAGIYMVSVTDINGCSVSLSDSVSEATAMVITLDNLQPVNCKNDNDGVIQISVAGGTTPYTYLWSNGDTTQDILGLAQGNFAVTVTDANNCSKVTGYTITEPTQLAASTLVTNVSCFGTNTGSIDISVSGGTLPYTYNWSDGSTAQDITNATAGNYVLTITDGHGCTISLSETLTQPSQLTILESQVDLSCNGATNGSIDITINGGSTPYSYNWSTGALMQDLSNLSAGTFTITVTDNNNCSVIKSIVLTQPSPLVITPSTVPALCGVSNGKAFANVAGGVPGYTYLWSTGSVTDSITAVGGGVYTVTVTDAQLCQQTAFVGVNASQAADFTIAKTDVTCYGGNDGEAVIHIISGTPPYLFNWIPITGTDTAVSGLAAGNYLAQVLDSVGCSSSKSITINEPGAFTIAINAADATCNAANNGAITLTVSGSTPPYTYLWSNGAITKDVNNLANGSYTVTVTDSGGCTITAGEIISEPNALNSTVTATNVSCNANADGTIELHVTGGTLPYSYLWSTGDTIEDLTGLTAGVYDVTTTDAMGCTIIDGTTITELPTLVVNGTVQNALCAGSNSGGISLIVSGGTSPYAYAWSHGSFNQDVTGLVAGTYTITVTDFNNCIRTESYSISEPATLTITADTISGALCFGQASGSITISVNGGTAPYTYLWSNAGRTSQDNLNITAGTYTVTVTDAYFCAMIATYAVGQPVSAITISITGISDAKCFGEASGFINVNASGGTAPYTYLWSNGNQTKNATGLAAGSYQVTVTDARGCTRVGNYNIGEPPAMVVTLISVSDARCYGDSSGSININVTGGTPAYAYLWSNGAATQDLAGVAADSYTVTVTDANGCVNTQTYAISQSPDIVIKLVDSVNVSCNGGADGSININVIGGTAPYTYNWSSGDNTQDLSGKAAGTYLVTVTDANSCVKRGTFHITEPDSMIITVTGISDARCYGQASGNIHVTVSGGIAPYTFGWSNGDSTVNATGLTAGAHHLTTTDSKGCSKVQHYNIGQPSAISINTLTTTNVLCYGDSMGALEIITNGGTAPYRFIWSTGDTTQNISNMVAGAYSVTVTDLLGCLGEAAFEIQQPDALVAELTEVINAKCHDIANGEIKVNVAGGTPPYQYNWSTGETTKNITDVGVGTYTLTVTDANDCEQQVTAEVMQPSGLTIITTEVTDVTCNGGVNGGINITINGATPPFAFLWSNGAITEDINGVGSGNYTVNVSDVNGCLGVKTINISQPSALNLDKAQIVQSSCEQTDGRVELNLFGGTAPYSYRWSDSSAGSTLDSISVGYYSVTVTDAAGCVDSASFVLDLPDCNLPPVAANDSVSIQVTESVEIPVLNNDYDPDNDVITVTQIVNPPLHGTITVNEGGTITYTPSPGFTGRDAFTYMICDDGNPPLCDQAIVYINISEDKPDLFIPDAISPNRDESNEYWEIRGIGGYPHNEVLIFNRWGVEVYRMNGYHNQWNGVNMESKPLPDGTYYYILKLNDPRKNIYAGFVTIFRG